MSLHLLDAELDALVAADGSRVSRTLFYDDDLYEQERHRIFQRCWLFVGHTSQVPAVGDFVTSYMGEEAVIVTRAKDGAVRVLVNSCSHRGTPVCRVERGNALSFTCSYHGWQFGNDGRLLGVPRYAAYKNDLPKDQWGLHQAARVATWNGLIFATFDAEAPSLEDYLGDDMRGYLETVYGRDEYGTVALGGVQRWMLDCNWKIPSENMSPDLYHTQTSHKASSLMRGADSEISRGSEIGTFAHVVQATTSEGHGFAFNMLPEDADPDQRLPGPSSDETPALRDFLRSRQAEAERRLGPVRARMGLVAGNVFPNFSVEAGVFGVRTNHPRGPGRTEVWALCLVPAETPDDVRRAMLAALQGSMGPGGLIEEEDGYNWVGMSRGVRSARTDGRPLHIGLGLGEEFEDPSMPGTLARTMWSEHNQRGFYRTWRRWMEDE